MYNRAQELLIVLLVVILALVSYTKTTEQLPLLFTKSPEYFLINLNTASWEELDLVSGIGPAWAKKIVEYRSTLRSSTATEDGQQIGLFKDIEELTNIKGISYSLIEKVRKYLTLE